MENFKVVIGQFINKTNGYWYVEACVDLREIMQKDKKLFKFLSKQKDITCHSNALLGIDNFIDALLENKKIYTKYKSFIKFAIKQRNHYEELGYYVYDLCRSIHKYGKRVKFKDDTPKESMDLINYICDRSLIQELELNEMSQITWDYIVNNINQA